VIEGKRACHSDHVAEPSSAQRLQSEVTERIP
jgi:hypothetical protein